MNLDINTNNIINIISYIIKYKGEIRFRFSYLIKAYIFN